MKSEIKKYNVIYADPPWQFRVWSNKGMSRSAENHYTTQSLQNLMAFDVSAICENDCVLLMWATFPCLKNAFELAEAWGFVYSCLSNVENNCCGKNIKRNKFIHSKKQIL